MKKVIIESPFSGDTERNIAYARACLKDSLNRGEAGFCSHLLYTQEGVLDDTIPEERDRGMMAGWTWGEHAELVAVYIDFGISRGMLFGIAEAESDGIPIEERSLGENWRNP